MGFRLLHTPGAHEPCHVGSMFYSYVFLSCVDSIPAQLEIVHILGCSGAGTQSEIASGAVGSVYSAGMPPP